MFLQLSPTSTAVNTDRQATRHRLIVAAAALFQRRGYYGVGTTDILSLAQAPRGSLYHHFPGGKAELAGAAVDWVAQEAATHTRHLRLTGNGAEKILETTANAIATWMEAKEFAEGSLFSALATCLDPVADALLQSRLAAAYTSMASEYEEMLRAAGFPAALAHEFATEIIFSIEGASVLARAQKNVAPIKHATRQLIVRLTAIGEHHAPT